MESTLRKIEKIIPKPLYEFFQPAYHYLLSTAGAIRYGFPSRKLVVIGVTGTKGKSSTVEIINAILEKAHFTTALSNSIRFKIADYTKPNMYKMSMPGRFFMQKFIHDAVTAGCTHAVIEITSEGAKQFRNRYIDLDIAVFTNLAPEHIERHGSYENYKQAKINIVKEIEKSSKKGTAVIVNKDDSEAPSFLKVKADLQIPFSLSDIEAFHTDTDGIKFLYKKILFVSPLVGEFNAYNILAAIKVAEVLNIDLEKIRKAVAEFGEIPGRAERIASKRNPGAGGFEVVVDYAHTPDSLEAVYKAFDYAKKKICILGNTGGGRDKWKRPAMGKIADEYCDHIILTNEDPYDEDPLEIVMEMKDVMTQKPVEIIMDRREAIRSALKLAKAGEVVIITGKGTDPYIMGANGSKEKWSDAAVVREELAKL